MTQADTAVAIDRLREYASADHTLVTVFNADLRSLITAHESQAKRLREVEGALRESVSTMAEQRQRFRRYGKSHAELDLAIEGAEAALQSPPATENGE